MRDSRELASTGESGPDAHAACWHDSASRLFRGRPVLAWTLERLALAASVSERVILCWDDQLERVRPIAQQYAARAIAQGPRGPVPQLDSVTAARRWADGWRGGLLGTCEFDRGFYAPCLHEIAASIPSDAFLLVDPSAALVDPKLIDGLIAHAAQAPADFGFFFSPAAPGLSGVLLRPQLIEQLAASRSHPGRYIGYMPDSPCPDPISQPHCAPVPMRVARTMHRFTLDSARQIARMERAMASLNGQLINSIAEQLVERSEGCDVGDSLPREVVLEVTTRRATRAVFRAGTHLAIERADLPLALARTIFAQLALADDFRLTFAGVGDALLAHSFFECLAAAGDAGIRAIHLETDLLGIDEARLDTLAAAPVDVISVHIPALTAATYEAVMGVDGCARVLQSVRQLVERRHALGRATPLIVPVFTKCHQNFAEMEPWYDNWLRTMGSAVIAGPSDFSGQIPDHSLADMSPPRRRPCARLASRMTILCDGTIVSCEQDVLGKQPAGRVGEDAIGEVWSKRFAALRVDHANGDWAKHALCRGCREWHRP